MPRSPYPPDRPDRRRVLRVGAAGLALPLLGLRAVAAALPLTPAQTAGPFYPRQIPADHDADLLRIDGRDATALGDETVLAGRVTDPAGEPLTGAVVEIWQCDANGRYHHPWDRRDVPLDAGFQGYGRTAHVHFRVSRPRGDALVTQMYVRGEPGNARDGILNRLEPDARERLLVALVPREGVLHGRFDLVLPPV